MRSLLLFLLLIPVRTIAQQDSLRGKSMDSSQVLSEVLVKSNLIPSSIRETPAAIGVLTRKDIERTDQSNLMGALNQLPGVYVHQGALNTNKMSLRGIGARSQYTTNRIKAYFEGIPISTAEGATTLDDIPPEAIERIELIKGPNSSLYGAGLGGAIHLYAREPERRGPSAEVSTVFGSFGLKKNAVNLSHGSENSQWYAGYHHLQTDSFRENGQYDRRSFSLHGNLNSGEHNSLSILANFTELFAYIPSSISLEQLQTDPRSAAFTWGASKGYESYDKGLLGVAYEHRISPGLSNTTSLYINFKDAYEPRPFDILKEEQVATGFRTKFNWKGQLFNLTSDLSFGGEYHQEWYDTATLGNLYEDFPGQGSVAGMQLSNNSQLRSYYNIFGHWKLEFSRKWSVEAGVNFNGTHYELTDLYTEDGLDQSGRYSFGNLVSPRLGTVYHLTDEKSLYASISHGFSVPTVAETLTPEGRINTGLEPETGMNYELGFKGNWFQNKLYTEVAVYSIQVRNLLVAERVAEDQYVGRNAGRTDHNGVEVFLSSQVDLSKDLRLRPYLNAALNFFRFDHFVDQGNDFSGNELPGVPEHTINGGFDLYSDFGFSLHTSIFHSGKMALDDANSAYNPSYTLLNIKVNYSYQLLDFLKLQLSGGVNNLFDETYASSILPNAVGFGGAAPRYYYPGAPVNYFGGVSLYFNF